MAEAEMMRIDHRDEMNNVDIICLLSYVDTALRQVSTCPSHQRNDTQMQDIDVIAGWMDVFEQRFQGFIGKPELYMPKAHPKPQHIAAPPEVAFVQNPDIQHILHQLSALRTELLYCEGSEKINNMHSQTSEVVIKPWIEKFRAFLASMRENVDPANAERTWFPEVNTQEDAANPGRPR